MFVNGAIALCTEKKPEPVSSAQTPEIGLSFQAISLETQIMIIRLAESCSYETCFVVNVQQKDSQYQKDRTMQRESKRAIIEVLDVDFVIINAPAFVLGRTWASYLFKRKNTNSLCLFLIIIQGAILASFSSTLHQDRDPFNQTKAFHLSSSRSTLPSYSCCC